MIYMGHWATTSTWVAIEQKQNHGHTLCGWSLLIQNVPSGLPNDYIRTVGNLQSGLLGSHMGAKKTYLVCLGLDQDHWNMQSGLPENLMRPYKTNMGCSDYIETMVILNLGYNGVAYSYKTFYLGCLWITGRPWKPSIQATMEQHAIHGNLQQGLSQNQAGPQTHSTWTGTESHGGHLTCANTHSC